MLNTASLRQQGFRPGRTTVGAIGDVVKSVENERVYWVACELKEKRKTFLLKTFSTIPPVSHDNTIFEISQPCFNFLLKLWYNS